MAPPEPLTASENAFRFDWGVPDSDRPAEMDSTSLVTRISEGGRTGYLKYAAGLDLGWKYEENADLNEFPAGEEDDSDPGSDSTFYVRPGGSVSYEREVGDLRASFRYSASYEFPSDDSFAQEEDTQELNQSAGLQLLYTAPKWNLDSSTSFTDGGGYSANAGQRVDRIQVTQAFAAGYRPTDWLAVTGTFSFELAGFTSGTAPSTSDSSSTEAPEQNDGKWDGSFGVDYVYSPKTRVGLEYGVGLESQQIQGEVQGQEQYDQLYQELLLRLGYQPSQKLDLSISVGYGNRSEGFNGEEEDAAGRIVYSGNIGYQATPKTRAWARANMRGTATEPGFSVGVTTAPRDWLSLGFSVYREQTSAIYRPGEQYNPLGAVLTYSQRVGDRLTVSANFGVEQNTFTGEGLPAQEFQEPEPLPLPPPVIVPPQTIVDPITGLVTVVPAPLLPVPPPVEVPESDPEEERVADSSDDLYFYFGSDLTYSLNRRTTFSIYCRYDARDQQGASEGGLSAGVNLKISL